jgi:hypothetical protein
MVKETIHLVVGLEPIVIKALIKAASIASLKSRYLKIRTANQWCEHTMPSPKPLGNKVTYNRDNGNTSKKYNTTSYTNGNSSMLATKSIAAIEIIA